MSNIKVYLYSPSISLITVCIHGIISSSCSFDVEELIAPVADATALLVFLLSNRSKSHAKDANNIINAIAPTTIQINHGCFIST